ncbi:MAG: GNAT superfamily N-acetyltransferase [Candidatus Azotimanducaceae bacterium]|jgi:GNAT superfamily N-acetyltransferase
MVRFFLGDWLVTDEAAGKNAASVPTLATVADLSDVNQVVEQAVMAWPLSERLRRLSLPLLTYTEADWQYYQFLVLRDCVTITSIAAWDPLTRLTTEHGSAALLHGLYVLPDWQGQGLGWRLVKAVAERAVALPVDGLLIKAERTAASYFKKRGLLAVPAANRQDYPYQFWLNL